MCKMFFNGLKRKGLESNAYIEIKPFQTVANLCKVSAKQQLNDKRLFSLVVVVRSCPLTSKPHSWTTAGEGEWKGEGGRVLTAGPERGISFPVGPGLLSITQLSSGQDVVSVCGKVYEKLAFLEERSRKFTLCM